MPGTLGVTIGEKHTLKDWNLGWTAITLGFPEPKTYELDIQGADGTYSILIHLFITLADLRLMSKRQIV